MKEYHVVVQGKQSGPFPESTVQSKVLSGEVSRDDLCWTTGMAEWQPIRSVISLSAGETPSSPENLPPPIPHGTKAPSGAQGYKDYSQVPWYRKSSVNSIFILISLISCGWVPGILAVCIIVLSGDVYSSARDDQGYLKKWGPANKVAACVLLLINIIALLYGFFRST